MVWLYRYAPTPSQLVLDEMLADFTGYLHCDGYKGYDTFAAKNSAITQVGCWYHVRRYFKDAEKLSHQSGLANHALSIIIVSLVLTPQQLSTALLKLAKQINYPCMIISSTF